MVRGSRNGKSLRHWKTTLAVQLLEHNTFSETREVPAGVRTAVGDGFIRAVSMVRVCNGLKSISLQRTRVESSIRSFPVVGADCIVCPRGVHTDRVRACSRNTDYWTTPMGASHNDQNLGYYGSICVHRLGRPEDRGITLNWSFFETRMSRVVAPLSLNLPACLPAYLPACLPAFRTPQ